MKIKKITRKVTGKHYDNIELEAEVNAGDDLYKVANELDELCKDLMDDIYEKERKMLDEKHQKEELKFKVQRFLKIIEGATPEQITKFSEDFDLPF